jgi:3-methyladenine DNA glycosylase AlkD
MLHPAEARVSGSTSPRRAVLAAKASLRRIARSPQIDYRHYLRADGPFVFLNTGTVPMRAVATSIYREQRDRWKIGDAIEFASLLMADRCFEFKAVGIEVLARFERHFTPSLLPVLKRWLANGLAANWATTDSLCGALLGSLICRHPGLADRLEPWTRHRSLWVRRASVVGLISSARKGLALDRLYDNAERLHSDDHDLIQKAVGWTLREAGKTDMPRLERYMRDHGPSIPRTTVRYAIERFPDGKRRALLAATRGVTRQSGFPGSGPRETRSRPT